ncbi:hypothetical protein [Phyllobacterium zundukense]|uniref:hypothetical protein n=1 Tax=Phyllobacterium zundukense TaxID=1867719 RepID=UPI000C1C1F1F|nr:hypothetical protein [Phyllobacterium zundukense]ATU92119.1 hypothetical protein BLM14_11095 [Phyllobacterium zundukense]
MASGHSPNGDIFAIKPAGVNVLDALPEAEVTAIGTTRDSIAYSQKCKGSLGFDHWKLLPQGH